MSETTASILVRPLRLGFLLDVKDRRVLKRILQVNACLWGGIFNYLIPVTSKTPARYRDYLMLDAGSGAVKRSLITGTGPSATKYVRGLLDAFQPDLLVETRSHRMDHADFDHKRIVSLDELCKLDENSRRIYGVDLRSVCRALYDESFRFIQRHPPVVIEPKSAKREYDLLLAAMFGEFPVDGPL